LAELAFHGWDFFTSIGRAAVLDEEVAALLLPTLLESNVPRTYAAGLSRERGAGERIAFVAGAERWVLTLSPEAIDVTRDGEADLTVAGTAAALALVIYGRLELPDAISASAVSVAGEPSLTERFAVIFPRP
jgi:hypothetical protein